MDHWKCPLSEEQLKLLAGDSDVASPNFLREAFFSPEKARMGIKMFPAKQLDHMVRVLKKYGNCNISLRGTKTQQIDKIINCLFAEKHGLEPQKRPRPPDPVQSAALPTIYYKKPRTDMDYYGNTQYPSEVAQAISQLRSVSSPFFEEVRELGMVRFTPPSAQSRLNQITSKYTFLLSEDDAQLIRAKKLFVHIRLYTFGMGEVSWSFDRKLMMNNVLVTCVQGKRLKTPEGKKPFVVVPPQDVSGLVLSCNTLTFSTSRFGKAGIVLVQLVRPIAISEITSTIPLSSQFTSRAKPKDEGLELLKMEVSVLCPLSCCRIVKPVKGIHCDHAQCFDLNSYLTYCKQTSVWHCPLCGEPCPPKDLLIDNLFMEILDDPKAQEDDVVVIINTDNTYTIHDSAMVAKLNKLKSQPSSGNIGGQLGTSNSGTLPLPAKSQNVRSGPSEVVVLIDSDDEGTEKEMPPLLPVAQASSENPIYQQAVPAILAAANSHGSISTRTVQNGTQDAPLIIDDEDDTAPPSPATVNNIILPLNPLTVSIPGPRNPPNDMSGVHQKFENRFNAMGNGVGYPEDDDDDEDDEDDDEYDDDDDEEGYDEDMYHKYNNYRYYSDGEDGDGSDEDSDEMSDEESDHTRERTVLPNIEGIAVKIPEVCGISIPNNTENVGDLNARDIMDTINATNNSDILNSADHADTAGSINAANNRDALDAIDQVDHMDILNSIHNTDQLNTDNMENFNATGNSNQMDANFDGVNYNLDDVHSNN